MLLAYFKFCLFLYKGFDNLALLGDSHFQVCNEPRDFIKNYASSFPSAREFVARGFVSFGEYDSIVLSSFLSSRNPLEL